MTQHYAELNVEPDEVVALGDDRVLARGHHRGRSTTGNDFVSPWAMVWTMRDGRAVRFQEYNDSAAITAAIGTVAASA